MLSFLILAIYKIRKDKKFKLKSFFKNKAYSGLSLVFFVVLLSGINSEEIAPWLLQVKLKIPFLILPFAFYVLRPIGKKEHFWIHSAFVIIVLVSSLGVIWSYVSDSDIISGNIGRGQSMPTPIDHIHYSIMIAYAMIVSVVFGILEDSRWKKVLMFCVGVYLFGFSHFLSVRTGLGLSYLSIGIVLIWHVIRSKKYILGLGFVALLVSLPFIAYKTIKPLKEKIEYMIWDIDQYRRGNGNNYSDSERMMSYAIAIELIKESPIVGHGIGDLRTIMKSKHKEKYGSKEKYIYPHNQYLYVWVSMGLLGFLIFFYGLLSPWIYTSDRNIFMVILLFMLLASFLIENTVERAIIIGFFLFFILLNLGLKKHSIIKIE